MATTTTIYAGTDANIRESNPTTNYGGATLLRVGQVTGSRRHGVFYFDVSSFTVPSDIIKAELKIATSFEAGVLRNMKFARLNQDFVEDEVTWNISATGTDWSGGGGAQGNGEFTQPTYSFTVGDDDREQTMDITELVIDAINKRDNDLWLVLCFDPDDSEVTVGWSAIHSSEAVIASNRPKIEVTVAERITWSGDEGDGDATNGKNWSSNPDAPTTSDYVYFNTGSASVTSNDISCHSLFISDGYTGEMITSAGLSIGIASDVSDTGQVAIINKKIGKFDLADKADYNRSVYIQNTPSEFCRYYNTAGSYNMFVDRTVGELEVLGESNLIVSASKNKKNVTTTGTQTDIIACSKTVTLDNGCNDITLTNNARVVCNAGTVNDITIAKGVFTQKSIVTNEVLIYSGEFNFKGNELAISETEDVTLYKGSIFKAKSNSTNWSQNGIMIIRGGNFLLDSGSLVQVN